MATTSNTTKSAGPATQASQTPIPDPAVAPDANTPEGAPALPPVEDAKPNDPTPDPAVPPTANETDSKESADNKPAKSSKKADKAAAKKAALPKQEDVPEFAKAQYQMGDHVKLDFGLASKEKVNGQIVGVYLDTKLTYRVKVTIADGVPALGTYATTVKITVPESVVLPFDAK